MSGERLSLEDRVEKLSQQLERLNRRTEFLYSYLKVADPEAVAVPRTGPSAGPADDEIIRWADRASLLPRLSTLCFLLVAALTLRTVTDNQLIDSQLGSLIGMGYAAALMLFGGYQYHRSSQLAPVFAVCGALLMGAIVVETHERFHTLPTLPAYALLMAAGVGMAAISCRFRVSLPILAGSFGMCLGGAAIDYPNPLFPLLAMVLFTANILGFLAARVMGGSWLRWIVLVVTIFMLTLWSTKIAVVFHRNEAPPVFLAVDWFIPVMALFTLLFPSMALRGILGREKGRIDRFDHLLPTLNAVWTFAAAHQAVAAWGGDPRLFGAGAFLLAAAHYGAALWLGGRGVEGSPGANAFVCAGSVILALALPMVLGSTVTALPLLSGTAVALALAAQRWKSGSVRFSSYLLQSYTWVALVVLLGGGGKGAYSAGNALAAGVLSILGVFHYAWCRKHPPPGDAPFFFSRYDQGDRSASILLAGALVSAFLAFRIGLHHALSALPGEFQNPFRCGQTILINVAATGLMVYAFLKGNKEIRNVAILATGVGAFKVFDDLLHGHGVPLVLSVFSFGLAALLESILLRRWSRQSGPSGGGREMVQDSRVRA